MTLRAVSGAMLLGIACVALMGGCSRERIDWKSAESADTQEAYDHFLERHPDGELAAQARTRLGQIAEDKDWQRTVTTDTADAYRQFLAQHPAGKWAEEARIRIENFSLDTHPSPTSDAPVARTSPPSVSPTPPTPNTKKIPSSETPPSKPESPGFGIQLGAFSTQSAALVEWKRLQIKFDKHLHGLFAHAIPIDVTSGKLFRLQSPVGDESRARSICAALTEQAQPCVVVLPNSH